MQWNSKAFLFLLPDLRERNSISIHTMFEGAILFSLSFFFFYLVYFIINLNSSKNSLIIDIRYYLFTRFKNLISTISLISSYFHE